MIFTKIMWLDFQLYLENSPSCIQRMYFHCFRAEMSRGIIKDGIRVRSPLPF